MQLPADTSSTLLVPLGLAIRSSLMMQYSRQFGYEYIKVPAETTLEDIVQTVMQKSKSKKVIVDGIKGTLQTLIQMEVKLNPDRLAVVQFGEEDQEIKQYFERLGKYHKVEVSESGEETYRNLRRATAPKVIFIYGPPLALKSEVAKAISSSLGYHYVDLGHLRRHQLKEADGVVFVNKFIKLSIRSNRNLVVDGFFEQPNELVVLEEYLLPHKVIHIKPTKDQVQSKIKALKKMDHRKEKAREFENYTELEKALVGYLDKKGYYLKVAPGQEGAVQKVLELLYPKIVYIDSEGDPKFPEQFAEQWNGTYLNPSTFAKSEIERETPFGGALTNNGQSSETSALYQQLIMSFKSIIYSSSNPQFVLCGLPSSVQHFQFFQQHIAPITNFVSVGKEHSHYSSTLTPEMMYLMRQKLIFQDSGVEPQHLIEKLRKRKRYLIVAGAQGCGKSTLAKEIAKEYHYKLIECETYLPTLKQKLITAEDGEELPIAKITKHFKDIITKQEDLLLFDGLPYEGKDLAKFLKDLGQVAYPLIINLKVDQKNLLRRNRKKAESDVNAEVTEQDTQRMDSLLEKNNSFLKTVEESSLHSQVKIYQLDFNLPLISCTKLVPSVLLPRVFLVTSSPNSLSTAIFLNICLKFRMDFVDLKETDRLAALLPNVKNCRQRDVVLINYLNSGLVSEDINWIEGNVGVLRYVCSWREEQKGIVRDKIPLEKPKVVEKPKKFNEEGEEIKDEEPEPEDPDAPPKPKLDIYEHEWSVTGEANNLSQWFLAFKQPNKQIVTSANEVFEEFEYVLKDLNNDRQLCVYQLIK